MRAWALRQLKESAGSYAASVAVVAVVSAFAVLLLETTEVFSAVLSDAGFDAVEAIRTGMTVVTVVFLGIAVVVAGIVISNTFSMVYAGRVKDIALLRLVGATGSQVRRTSLIDGAIVGAAGAAVGILAGIGLSFLGLALIEQTTGAVLPFVMVPQLVLVPMLGGMVATTAASFAGSRSASRVAPIEASRDAAGVQRVTEKASRIRVVLGLVLVGIGAALLALGLLAGAVGPLGLLIAFPGGVASIVGVIVASPVLMPPVLKLASHLLPSGAPARLAAASSTSDPVRTSRTLISVVIGVALLTMFTVAGEMFLAATRDFLGDDSGQTADAISGLLTTVYVLVGFSVVVAGIGLGSTLSLSVLQRRRELGVLRAVGFTTGQARLMLMWESLLVTVVGVVVGLLLGTVYGFVGANSILGSQYFGPPLLPVGFAAVVVAGAIVFGLLASLAPGVRASRVPPAEALRVA